MPWNPALKAPVSEIEQASAPQHWRDICRNWWVWESILWTSLEQQKETIGGFVRLGPEGTSLVIKYGSLHS